MDKMRMITEVLEEVQMVQYQNTERSGKWINALHYIYMGDLFLEGALVVYLELSGTECY